MDFEQWIVNRPMLLPHSLGHQVLSNDIGLLHGPENWLEDAVPLNVYGSKSKRLRGLVNRVYEEVATVIKVSNASKTKDAIKTELINLWFAKFMGKPVRYSRDRSAYKKDRRYGQLFFKYDRMVPVIDALEQLGYVEQANGFYVSDEGRGRQSRMWATPKLWQQFFTHRLREPDFFHVRRPEEVIILRDKTKFKHEVGYANTPAINQLRAELERYNDFLNEHQITVNLHGPAEIDYRFLVETLYHGIVNNSIVIQSIVLSTTVSSPTRPYVHLFNPIPYQSIKSSSVPYHSISITMTQKKLPESTSVVYLRDFQAQVDLMTDYLSDLARHVASIPDTDHANDFLSERFPLREIGVEYLELRLAHEYLHRVFNRKSFKLGGRAYGAVHQSIPSEIRPCVFIDGQPTIELDYSAYHPLMLYHLERIDYQDDVYSACEGPEMRDIYKVASLVAINAENEDKAYGGISKKLKKEGIPLPAGEKPLVRLVSRFKEAHPRIDKYICADMGVRLMYLDSRIMNNILMKLMDQDILGLSVYDSVIVAEQNRGILYQLMMDEYEKIMGFKPRIG